MLNDVLRLHEHHAGPESGFESGSQSIWERWSESGFESSTPPCKCNQSGSGSESPCKRDYSLQIMDDQNIALCDAFSQRLFYGCDFTS